MSEKEAPLREHLVELGVRVRRSIIAILVASLLVSIAPSPLSLPAYKPLVMEVPAQIVSIVVPRNITAFDGRNYTVKLMPTTPFESIDIMVKTSILLGLVTASPYVVYEIWGFVEPALYPHEKKLVRRYGAVFVLLFLSGVGFGLLIVVPWIVRFTLSLYPLLTPVGYELIIPVSIDDVIGFTVGVSAVFGILFETPLVVYLLLAYGIVEPSVFSGNTMKLIFVALLVVSAMISPDPSGLGMLALASALYLPIHVAVKLGKRAYEKRRVRMEEAVTGS